MILKRIDNLNLPLFYRLIVFILAFSTLCLSSCSNELQKKPDAPSSKTSLSVSKSNDHEVKRLIKKHKVATLGMGMIRNGQLAWTKFYGEQKPGTPASTTTMFNTASMSKAITSEVAIRLIARGVIDLDEAISKYYIHPDILDDERHNLLTPRILLTHTTGFLNWPHNYEDGKLAFTRDPGEAYGYAGIGFKIFAKFLEKKLGKTFPQIVREEVYDPIGIVKASQIQEKWMDPYVVTPVDKNGKFLKKYNLNYGYWNPADDLFVTVEEYAKFLIAVMNNDGLGETAIKLRTQVQSNLTNDQIWGCDDGGITPCPSPYGHSIGWFVYGYGERLNIQHGGNDMSEAATGYFKTDTRDGMVIFINAPAPEGVLLYPKLVDLFDRDQKFTNIFHYVIAKFIKPESEPKSPRVD